jgi:hypothetical protein
MVALYQIPDEQVLGGGMGHPGFHPIGVGGDPSPVPLPIAGRVDVDAIRLSFQPRAFGSA